MKKATTKCIVCGKPTTTDFCSMECGFQYIHHTMEEKVCVGCGKKLEGKVVHYKGEDISCMEVGSCADCIESALIGPMSKVVRPHMVGKATNMLIETDMKFMKAIENKQCVDCGRKIEDEDRGICADCHLEAMNIFGRKDEKLR